MIQRSCCDLPKAVNDYKTFYTDAACLPETTKALCWIYALVDAAFLITTGEATLMRRSLESEP